MLVRVSVVPHFEWGNYLNPNFDSGRSVPKQRYSIWVEFPDKAMSNVILFEDIFVIDKLNPDGKKFDKVTRIEARSQRCDMFMHLDVNTEIYPMSAGDKFTLALAHTLNLDGTPDTGYFTPGARKTLADKYEYIMHGKLYKITERNAGKSPKAEIFVSFGGLLMLLRGDPSHVSSLELDQRLFLLLRKL